MIRLESTPFDGAAAEQPHAVHSEGTSVLAFLVAIVKCTLTDGWICGTISILLAWLAKIRNAKDDPYLRIMTSLNKDFSLGLNIKEERKIKKKQ